jgi:3'-phosphoadenosine 5'-phosphosulfate sulfotransferase (PAPS reductase)/FAD synthetase
MLCQATATPKKARKRAKPAVENKALSKTVVVKLHQYDWVVLNSSAGKDSQTTIRYMVRMARLQNYPLDRLVVVHCDLGSRVEWDGTRELAEEQAKHYGLRFVCVSRPQGDILDEVRQRAVAIWSKAVRAAGETPEEDFTALKAQAERLTTAPLPAPWPSNDNRWCTSHHKTNQVSKLMTRLASPWPSNDQRWCTSDQKRGQVARVMTTLADETRKNGVRRPARILNCMGMRANESNARSKLLPFKVDRAQSGSWVTDEKTGVKRYRWSRTKLVHTYLPIFHWGSEDVWADIKASGVRHHPAYDLGMLRLSCCFCIYAPKNALLLAGKHNPAKLDEYVRVEQEVGSRFRVELSLLEVREALDRGEEPGEQTSWEM